MAMSSYLSNLLTQTTSKYNSLRRTLLSSEDDGDTEDDTHVCRVLRAYYTEKGRPFPHWLPPDPNDRKAVTPQPTYGALQQQHSSYGSYFGSAATNNSSYGGRPSLQPAGSSTRNNLSDLWDPPSAQSQSSPMQPSSLRAARRPGGASQASSAASLAPPPQARPLPSQRAGSYQNISPQASRLSAGGGAGRPPAEPSPPSTSSSVGSGTAQDRLKARLWGGRSNTGGSASPAPSQVGAANPYEQPYGHSQWGGQGGGSGNPYDTGGGGNRRYGRPG